MPFVISVPLPESADSSGERVHAINNRNAIAPTDNSLRIVHLIVILGNIFGYDGKRERLKIYLVHAVDVPVIICQRE